MAKSNRFKNLVHYICDRCSDPTKLGATKLNKVLWYSDTIAYRLLGKSISGERAYVKRQYGPVPKNILQTLEEMEADNIIRVREAIYFGRPKKEYISLVPADESAFTKVELAIVDEVIEAICADHTAASISDLSHNTIWEAAEIGEEIPIYAVFAANAAQVTDEDMLWANKIIEKRHP